MPTKSTKEKRLNNYVYLVKLWSKVTAFWNIDRTVKSTCVDRLCGQNGTAHQINHSHLWTNCNLYIPMSTADQAKSKNSTRAVYAILALLILPGSSDLKKINKYILSSLIERRVHFTKVPQRALLDKECINQPCSLSTILLQNQWRKLSELNLVQVRKTTFYSIYQFRVKEYTVGN